MNGDLVNGGGVTTSQGGGNMDGYLVFEFNDF